MNKYLMMSAAAVLAGTAGTAANAANNFTFGTAYGGAYCDGGTVLQHTSIWSWAHTNNNCYGGTSYGIGVLGKSAAVVYPPTGLGFKSAVMSDVYFCQNDGLCSWAISYALPKKIANGNPWVLFIKFSGTSAFLGNYGTLTSVSGHNNAKTSTISKLKELIAVHRNSQH
ncbi:MAG TPA: hypothetical protein VL286_04590 [Rhizomicrobium sp.]|nr:hypothetical protein [Rhizomicrobium sp.]